MQLQRIDAQHPLFDAAFALYEQSFPPNERRTRADQLRALGDAEYFPLCAVQNDTVLADLFVWRTPDFTYLEHFAVQPSLRGQGLGGALLEGLICPDKPLVLEIEPPEDECKRRRKVFYERHGLQAQPYAHVQLPFQGGGAPAPLIIMTDRAFSAEQCRAFQAYLLERVVRYTQYRLKD